MLTPALVLLIPGGTITPKPGFIFSAISAGLSGGKGENKLLKKVLGGLELAEPVIAFMKLIRELYDSPVKPLPVLTDAQLQSLTKPVLLIAGEKDAVYNSRKLMKRVQKNILNVLTIIKPECGHVLINTKNDVSPR